IRLEENEAIVNEVWLKQIMEYMSKEAMENGALDDDAVTQMAQASHLASAFCVSIRLHVIVELAFRSKNG
ncbi:hypothetical protein FRC07_006428, partial [Ceratobasidium sp. 392]